MPYATVADLVAEFGEDEVRDLTDRASPPAGEIDAAVAGRALTRAETTVNGYLAGRYTLPAPADAVRGYVLDLARGYLYVNTMPETVKNRYDAAMRDLKAVGQGLMALPVAPASEPAPAGAGMAVRTRKKTFGG
jgi:phage gp36-like protein